MANTGQEALGLSKAQYKTRDFSRDFERGRRERTRQREQQLAEAQASQEAIPDPYEPDIDVPDYSGVYSPLHDQIVTKLQEYAYENSDALAAGDPQATMKFKRLQAQAKQLAQKTQDAGGVYSSDIKDLSDSEIDKYGMTTYINDINEGANRLKVSPQGGFVVESEEGDVPLQNADFMTNPRKYYFRPMDWRDEAMKDLEAVTYSEGNDEYTLKEDVDEGKLREQIQNQWDYSDSTGRNLKNVTLDYLEEELGLKGESISPNVVNAIASGETIERNGRKIGLSQVEEWYKDKMFNEISSRTSSTFKERQKEKEDEYGEFGRVNSIGIAPVEGMENGYGASFYNMSFQDPEKGKVYITSMKVDDNDNLQYKGYKLSESDVKEISKAEETYGKNIPLDVLGTILNRKQKFEYENMSPESVARVNAEVGKRAKTSYTSKKLKDLIKSVQTGEISPKEEQRGKKENQNKEGKQDQGAIYPQRPSKEKEKGELESEVLGSGEDIVKEDLKEEDVEKENTKVEKAVQESATAEDVDAPSTGFSAKKGSLNYPVEGEIVSQFGKQKHPNANQVTIDNKGVDIKSTGSGAAFPASEGKVTAITKLPSGNYAVMVKHGDGYITVYRNLNNLNVKKGDEISPDQRLGEVASENTKYKAAPVMGFQVWKTNKNSRPTAVNPMEWLGQKEKEDLESKTPKQEKDSSMAIGDEILKG